MFEGGPTMPLEQAQQHLLQEEENKEEKENLSVTQLHARRREQSQLSQRYHSRAGPKREER